MLLDWLRNGNHHHGNHGLTSLVIITSMDFMAWYHHTGNRKNLEIVRECVSLAEHIAEKYCAGSINHACSGKEGVDLIGDLLFLFLYHFSSDDGFEVNAERAHV